MDAFHILPATVQDAEGMRLCYNRAMAGDYLFKMTYPEEKVHLTPSDELFAWQVHHLREYIRGRSILHFKVVPKEDHSKILGFASWSMPVSPVMSVFKTPETVDGVNKAHVQLGKGKTRQESVKEGQSSSTAHTGSQQQTQSQTVDPLQNESTPECMNDEVRKEFLNTLDDQRDWLLGTDPQIWHLLSLYVDPAEQRRGIGTMLLRNGLNRADKDGIPTYVEAAQDALGFYPKFGFEKIGEYGFFSGNYTVQFFYRHVPLGTNPGRK